MDIFGKNWQNYEEKIKQDWLLKVKPEDTVILPGDFSWAMYLDETDKDFEFINNLPGQKILLKGNHDYWWTTVTSMRRYIQEQDFKNIDFLYNNSYEFENKIIAGTKGWNISEDQEDIRLTKREVARLELSIQDGISKYGEDKEIIVFMHYPPLTKNYINTDYTNPQKVCNKSDQYAFFSPLNIFSTVTTIIFKSRKNVQFSIYHTSLFTRPSICSSVLVSPR